MSGDIRWYDPNPDNNTRGAALPELEGVLSKEQYSAVFSKGFGGKEESLAVQFARELSKADPPVLTDYSNSINLPTQVSQGVVQWPGFQPSMLQRLARNHLAVHAIIQQRIADIGRYSELSNHPWVPGWRVEMSNGFNNASKSDLVSMREAERFLLNGYLDSSLDARKRDSLRLNSFRHFLESTLRDSLTYAMETIWTDMDDSGKVLKFKAMPSNLVRLCTDKGYCDDPELFAVMIDENGAVKQAFNRNQLTVLIRNPRLEPDIGGYGFPEIEMAATVVKAITNAFELNATTFTKDAVPQGILRLKGGSNVWPRDILANMQSFWKNLLMGITKKNHCPAVVIPKEGDVDLLDLSNIVGNDIRYESFINLSLGFYCAILGFPIDRIGYYASGKSQDNKKQDAQTDSTIIDNHDPFLEPMLLRIANNITEYLIRPNWPHLQFRFQGSNPREDLRAYEARMLSGTLDEKRALCDMPKLEDIVEGAEQKELAKLMGMCPVDPSLAGVYQAVLQIKSTEKTASEKPPEVGEARMTSKNDPVKSAAHGHASGVRRDSASERSNAEG